MARNPSAASHATAMGSNLMDLLSKQISIRLCHCCGQASSTAKTPFILSPLSATCQARSQVLK